MTHWPEILSPRSAADASAPLRGAWIIWTRPADSGEAIPAALAGSGATVALAPAIELKPLAARKLELFLMSLDHLREWRGWLVLPSPAAIRHFGALLDQAGLDAAACTGIRIAPIGPGSAAALDALGLHADFMPPEPSAASLAATLPAGEGTAVLIAGSSQSRPELQEGLRQRGLRVQFLALYEPCPCPAGIAAVAETLDRHPGALLGVASPSAAEAILEWFDARECPRPAVRWLAIGPTTRQLLIDRGVAPDAVLAAAAPDAAGVAAAAVELLARPQPPEASGP